MNSYFTPAEWAEVFAKWPGDKQLAWQHVSQTQLSIARHYGGILISGRHYTYFPATDELIRDDVLKMVTKARKAAKQPAQQQEKLL